MFARLFRPKWEHTDPRIRRKALESGDAPPEAVAKAAQEDEDLEVRRCAVEQLTELGLLAALIGSDPVSRIQEAADHRLRGLLAGPLPEGPPLEPRLQAIGHAESPDLCAFLARQAQAAEIRTAALQQVEDTDVLCAVAADDPVAAVRRAALDRIEDPEGWEKVARSARKRHKEISRVARERLDAHRKIQSDREAAERLSVEMEALAGAALHAESPMRFRRLSGQWDKLESPIPSQIAEGFGSARAQACVRIERFEAMLAERRAICVDLEGLLGATPGGEGPDAGAAEGLIERLEEAIGRWEAAVQEADDEGPLAERFGDLVKEVRQRSEHLARDHARARRLKELVRRATAALDDPAALQERRIKGFQRRWAELERPESGLLADALQQEFDTVQHALREQLNQQIRQRKHALEEAEQLISDLEEALTQGELEHALSLRDKARHRLKTAKGVAEPKRLGLQARLQGTHERLEHLRKWRHWGSGHARGHLCGEIETLAGSALTPAEIAARVRSAREAWRRIDRAEGPAPEALWHRFDQACTLAYEPYQHERREQAALLQEHLAQKQALCHELDGFERGTDWKDVDWHETDRRVRKACERWRRIGPVPRKALKALEKTYRDVLERLEAHLGPERERELRRRQALIARVEGLANAPDPRAATREVKEAQRNWKPTVQAPHREEQALWEQFRAACDAVFSRIRQDREAADTERRANLDRKTALCAELEGLLDDAGADYQALTRRFAAADGEWAGIGAIPRQEERAIEGRYEALKERLADRQRQEAQAAAEAVLQGMQERSRLCERREVEVLESPPAEHARQALVEETLQAWQALAPLDPHQEEPLRARFDLAGHALNGDDEARRKLLDALAPNLDHRLELCLRMEVATGIDSPAEFAEARMQFQVARLSDALHHRLQEPRSGGDPLRDLQIAWFQAGPVPRETRETLEARFERVLAATQSS